MANTKKQDIVGSVTSTIDNGANFALITFSKATHKALEALRKELRTKNAKLSVVKNTLFEKAVNKLSEKDVTLQKLRKTQFPLKDRAGLLTFDGDWSEGLKVFFKSTKSDETFGFKFGRIDSTVYDRNDMLKLSQLPGKNELVAKLLGAMKNPMVRTVRSMNHNMQTFVYILNQKAQKG